MRTLNARTHYVRRAPGLLGALILGVSALIAGPAACGVGGHTVLIHEPEADAARVLWEVDFTFEFTIPEKFRYSTEEYGSAAADPVRGLVYIGSRDGTLMAIDDLHGEVVWETTLHGGVSAIPVLAVAEDEAEGGSVRLAKSTDKPDWMLVGTDDGTLIALDLETHEVVWRYHTSGLIREAPVVGEGVVHFVNSRDEVFTLDARTGEWVWQYAGEFQKDFTVFGRAGLAYLPPVDAAAGDSGTLYTGFADGKVVALDATSGAARWVESLAPVRGNKLFVDVDTTPLIAADRGEIVVANQSSGVFALAMEDGARRWNTPIRAVGSVVGSPSGVIVAASSLEGIFGLEQDGRVRWHEQLDPGALASPLVVGDTVVVAHSDLGILAYETGSGELLLRLFNGSGSSGQPIFDPVLDRVYATSDRGLLYALHLRASGPVSN